MIKTTINHRSFVVVEAKAFSPIVALIRDNIKICSDRVIYRSQEALPVIVRFTTVMWAATY